MTADGEAILVFGAGWIGTQLAERLPGALLVRTDIADETALSAVLDQHAPRRVVNCAGKTGRPNVDSLECEPEAAYRSNVAGPVLLAGLCRRRGIHMTHLGSGCLYQGDAGGAGFAEDDPPNFRGSLYSRTKIASEAALRDLDVLQLRLRMPISSTPNARNLLTKLLSFEQVVSMPNSVTVLDDFWRPAFALMARREAGVWNLVNPGIERHDDVLALWRERVDPSHAFGVISEAALARQLTAARSNCVLSTAKLEAAGLGMPTFTDRLPALIDAYAKTPEGAPA